jgi:hypothetical protein
MTGAKIADTVVRLRGGLSVQEHLQRVVVEHVQRTATEGEGGVALK